MRYNAEPFARSFNVIQNEMRLVVLAYDIQKNKLLQILTPFEPAVVTLGIVDGCLSAIIRTWQDRRLELWIMKEYGVEGSWTKYVNIEGFKKCRTLSPIGFLPDGDLILNVGNKKIVKYSFSDKKDRCSALLCSSQRLISAAQNPIKTMAHIPSNLYEEILYLLPSNNLLNLKCVCKDWNELISSQRFIQKHFHRSKTGCSATLIAMLSPSKITVCDISTGNESRWSISYPPEFSFNNTKIAGSCDGLVCLVQGRSKVFAIINPSTGKSEVSITDRFVFGPLQGYWFGKHPSTGEYSIIAIETSLDLIQVYQFSSKKTSLQNFSIGLTLSQSDIILILLHGALHWPVIQCDVRSTLVVLAYDIQKNKLLQIWTPFEPAVVTLRIVDGCLSAITDTCPDTCQDSRLELWIMKEYGVEESWAKYANIEDFKGYRALSPLGFLPDGNLILDVDDKKIAKYSFSDKKGTFLCVYRGDNFEKNKSAVLCVDSLVSPALFWKD